MGVRAIDVANFFINEFKDTEDPMTKTRIQKFMYYAQAQSMVRLGHPLFEEDFEAWKFGPVIPEIGSLFMNKTDGAPIRRVVGNYDIHVFNSGELEVLLDVSNYCGGFSTAALSKKTHVPGGPWDIIHNEEGKPRVITKDAIRNYYSDNEPIPSVLSELISKLPTVGRADENGHTVIPADDDWE